MAEITASMVKELREKTDAPMMECKKALTEAGGDLAKAEEILRVKLGNKASKAATRIAAEGVVAIHIAADGKLGSIFEINSETDFVAKNDEFLKLASDCARLVAEKNPADAAPQEKKVEKELEKVPENRELPKPVEAAIKNAEDAINFWIKTAKDDGKEIPEPRGRLVVA